MIKKRTKQSFSLASVFFLLSFLANAQEFKPTHPVLPDSVSAIVVGGQILRTYFPKRAHVANSPGYGADLRGDVWVVYEKLPVGMVGGGPTVELAKSDARVLRIYMTR